MNQHLRHYLPLVIISVLAIAVPLLLGAPCVIVLIAYGAFLLSSSLGCYCYGVYMNQGFFVARVKSNRRLDGHCAIVTGANRGVGFETAKALVQRGCHVILTCRSDAKAASAKNAILEQLSSANSPAQDLENFNNRLGEMSHLILDLSSKQSIDSAVAIFCNMNLDCNILVCNAGVWLGDTYITDDGMEATWQTNYYGHFYFIQQVLERIISASEQKQFGRIINVTSIMSEYADDACISAFLDANLRISSQFWSGAEKSKSDAGSCCKAKMSTVRIYCNTKCAQIMHTRSLQKVLEERGVGNFLYCMGVHPGWVDSGFMHSATRDLAIELATNLMYPFMRFFAMLNNEQGAQSIIHCVLEENGSDRTKPGGYHAHCEPKTVTKKVEGLVTKYMDKLYKVSLELWS